MLKKSTFREIKSSLGRYLAILAIVALGVGFFSGLKVTKEAMVQTADSYLKEQSLFDYKLISTLGFEEEDVKKLSECQYVDTAEGSVSTDALYHLSGQDFDNVLKFHSLTGDVNRLRLMDGRMPEESDECVIDYAFGSEAVGKELIISQKNDDDTLDIFKYKKLKIVGTVVSPVYLNFERGTTALGNGSVNGFAYMLPEAFDTDYYTEVYLGLEDSFPIYSDQYKKYIDQSEDSVKKALTATGEARYKRIYDEAMDEWNDGKKEYDDGVKEYEEGFAEYEDGLKEYSAGKKEYEDGLKEYKDGLKEYNDGKKEYEDGLKEYKKGLKEYKAEKETAYNELAEAKEKIALGQAEIAENEKKLNENEATLNQNKTELETSIAELEQGIENSKAYGQPTDELEAQKAELEANLATVNEGLAQVEAGRTEIESSKAELSKAEEEYNAGKAQADKEFAEAKAELDKAKSKLDTAEVELPKAKRELTKAKSELNDAKNELAEAEVELADAKKELNEAKEELVDAKAELDEGLEDINDLKHPDTYVLDRDTNVGYACFESDSDIVNGISKVFPLFFFLVAALVCMTTMTRMVDEQRTQIGVLKALGYSNLAVMSKYLFYSGSAAFIGSVIGFFGGSYIFPLVIWKCYGMMYDFNSQVQYVINWKLGAGTLAAALICSMGSTLASVINEFREVPAQLIRPKAPKSGKRILLERIPLIWNRLSFLQKVSIRNVFRYKKRFLMMLLGISGCTALLVAGLGIRDSIGHIADYQFDEIQTFDYSITYDKDMTLERQKAFTRKASNYFDDIVFVGQSSADYVMKDGKVKSITLIAADGEKDSGFDSFVNLHTKDGTHIDYPGSGEAVICTKLARAYNIEVGQTITVRDQDMRKAEVKVTGICENFIHNYVYITCDTYTEDFGVAPEIKSAYVKCAEDSTEEEIQESSAKVLDMKRVAAVSVNNNMRDRIGNMMKSLNYVVILVVLCAAMLAFVVLYNLTNINITERIREIATIKVLGFRSGETVSYVFRENILLTAVSAFAGLAMGRALLEFIMFQINVDLISFDVRISTLSYILSVVFTFLFAFLVGLVMKRKLDSISMTESLKSIE